jgi:hypothetical protein
VTWREATARRASGSLEFNCKIRNTDSEQEPGRGIEGFELACLTPGSFQWVTVGYDHVAVRHSGIADLNMLESAGIQQKFKFSFSHFFLFFIIVHKTNICFEVHGYWDAPLQKTEHAWYG